MGPGAEAAGVADWASATAAATTRAFGMDVIVARERISAVAEGLRARGAGLAGMWAYEALRIAARRPRVGLDTDQRTSPHAGRAITTPVHPSQVCDPAQGSV